MGVKKRKRKRRKNIKIGNKGFSLVEILAVIVIIGILSSIGIVAYSRYKERAIEQDYEALRVAIQNASDEYIMDHPNATEFTVQDLLDGEYISNIKDPKNKGQDIKGKIMVKKDPSSDMGEKSYTINYCATNNYNVTFDSSTGAYSDDQRCKAEPYDLNSLPIIKVLNVYPTSGADKLKGWMDSYGMGKISVTPVSLDTFNSNPGSYLKKSGGKWNYDEVVFGFWDCNASKDLTASSANKVDQFLNEGGSAIFGHDTLTKNGCGSHTNFNSLAGHVGLTLNGPGVSWSASNKVKIVKKGVFTEFPHKIGDVGTILTIPSSHVYGQVANGEVWITFEGYSGVDANKIYLSTYGNNAFIQTGHTNGGATPDEQKIIANIIIYMIAKQYVND